MAEKITVSVVEARVRDLTAASVNQTVSLFKGGIFALAAVVLVEIAFSPDDRTVRLVLWTASLFAAMTSYNAWLSGAVTMFREGVPVVIAIIAQGMIELMLFATLTPRSTPQAWRYWIVVMAALMFVTGLRLAVPFNKGAESEPELAPLFDHVAENRRRASRRVLGAALAATLIAFPIVALPLNSAWPQWLSLAFGVFNIGFAGFAMIRQQEERVAIERLLAAAKAPRPAG